MLEGEDRERALALLKAGFIALKGKGEIAEGRTLDALEREFVLVRPAVDETGKCDMDCSCLARGEHNGRDYTECCADLEGGRVGQDYATPGPNCPARKE